MVFPLIKTKWSNEHLMTGLLLVLMLYNLPSWVETPAGMIKFLTVIVIGLVVDVVFHFIRFRKPMCAVSAAITTTILYTLAPQLHTGGLIIGTIVALSFGKHAQGGAGKNLLNPAMLGYLLLTLLYPLQLPLFNPSWLLLPAILLSLPFVLLRPFASIGLMLGMVLQLFVQQEFSLDRIVVYGIIFWAGIVITDPVTITAKPLVGGLGGFIAGFVMLLFPTPTVFAAVILLFNSLSWLLDRWIYQPVKENIRRFTLPKIALSDVNQNVLDLTGGYNEATVTVDPSNLVKTLKDAELFGQGGAGFPTWRKLETLLLSGVQDKHLIINAVECDPGLIHDKWLLQNKSVDIQKGIELLIKTVGFHSVTIAVKDANGLDYSKVKIHTVPDFYPLGAEKILIKTVLGNQLKHGDIPAQKGILVLNIQTVLSIYEASLGKKADTRFITVANHFTGEARVAKVKLESKIREVLDRIYPQTISAFAGGGIMQAHLSEDEELVGTSTNYIAVGKFPHYKESLMCSKCGICSSHCPAGLEVQKIAQWVDDGFPQRAKKYHPERCLSCGSCSYVCLAGRNLCDRVRVAKEAK